MLLHNGLVSMHKNIVQVIGLACKSGGDNNQQRLDMSMQQLLAHHLVADSAHEGSSAAA